MATVTETRLTNARTIAEQVGGQSAFARRMSASRQQANHIIGANPIKPIGDRLARKIERTFGYPVGWLDKDHTPVGAPGGVVAPFVDVPLMGITEFTSAPRGDVSIEYIRITKSWLRRNVEPTAYEYLSLHMQRGDSMGETILDGDTLLIDRGQSSIQTEGLYVIALDGEVMVKRAQLGAKGAVTLTCDNDRYQPIELDREGRSGLVVLGRVQASLRMMRL